MTRIVKGVNDLATTHPEIAKEAYGWDPTTVIAGSHKKLKWECNKHHRWISSVGSRTINGSKCLVCSNQKVLAGFNDLATTHPEIAKEAYGWDPRTVVAGSGKRLEWKCKYGHIWTAVTFTRKQTNCPVCANKKVLAGFNDYATTHPELAQEADGWDPTTVIGGTNKKLKWKCSNGHKWEASGNSRATNKSNCPVCSNQKVLEGVNDLATTHPELAQEADGWDPTTVIAGTNKKLKWKCSNGHKWEAVGSTRVSGTRCPTCVNRKVKKGFNDLATTHPELAQEAYGWDPTTVIAGTNKKLKWKCKNGHIWVESGELRKRGGCPYCSNHRLLKGFNDLQTTYPAMAKEADGWDPAEVISGTHKRLNWKCDLGHQWNTSVRSRTNSGSGCPSCAKTGFDPNKSAYLYFLIQPIWEIYQIGITNQPHDRLQKHTRNGFDLLEIRGPMNGHTAKELEDALLQFLKSQKADLSPDHVAGRFDGYSESWTIDSYKVNNLKELIDKASEAGF
jgi:hypothetical protein